MRIEEKCDQIKYANEKRPKRISLEVRSEMVSMCQKQSETQQKAYSVRNRGIVDMGKTYKFQAAKVAKAKGWAPETVERSLRGKMQRRKEARDKRDIIRKAIEEGTYGME